MNKIKTLLILILVVPSIALSGVADNDHRDKQRCNQIKSKKIDLTGDGKPETIFASVYGKNCAEARYSVTIESETKKVMYNFSEKFKFMYVARNYDVEETEIAISRLFERTFSFTGKLMPEITKLVHKDELKGILEYRTVDEKRYLKLKSNNLRYVSHPTLYEGGVYIVFDPEINRIIKFGGW